jgi:LacI family transcriptional regulator
MKDRRNEAPEPVVPAAPAPRARLADIARLAGVSSATADRVINHRPGVRTATMHRVLKVAAEMGYLPASDLMASLRPKPMQLVFLLPTGTNRYFRLLANYIDYAEEQLADLNVRCRYHFVEGFNPNVLAERLRHYGRRADGIAFMALEHPQVREAVNTLADAGVHVLTLISDVSNSQRVSYVGMDNRAAGRTAAYLLARFIGNRKGKIAMLAGSLSYRAHEERELGFSRMLEEMLPAIPVVDSREGRDDAETNYRQARGLLAQYPDLVGIYNTGGASDGVARALKEAGRDQKVVFIGHGLTQDTRALLIDGTLDAVINQQPQNLVMNSVRIFSNLRQRRNPLVGVEPIRISVVLRENLP